MSNSSFFDKRFEYDGELPDTDSEWADLLSLENEEEEMVVQPFSPGAYSLLFISGLGSGAFECRTVQGRVVGLGTEDEEYQWFIEDKACPVLAARAAGDGIASQIGHPLAKVQVKTSAVVTRATIVVNARWAGR